MNIEQKITSMEVAEMVGKDHSKLLRDIRTYIDQLGQANIGQSDFFIDGTYQNSQNKTQPCYYVTKKGCEFIAHKLTGVKGTEFTAKYINRFHEMEESITVQKPMTALEMIKLQNQAVIEIDEKVDNLTNDFESFKQEMPLLGVDMDKVTHAVKAKGVEVMGGKDSLAYRSNSLRQQVYSDIYRQIKYQFNVLSYKALSRNQLDKALKIIDAYEPPVFLKDSIDAENSQMRIDRDSNRRDHTN